MQISAQYFIQFLIEKLSESPKIQKSAINESHTWLFASKAKINIWKEKKKSSEAEAVKKNIAKIFVLTLSQIKYKQFFPQILADF